MAFVMIFSSFSSCILFVIADCGRDVQEVEIGVGG